MGWARFRAIAPAGNTVDPFREMLQLWQAVVNIASDLTGPRFEPQTSLSRDEHITAQPTAGTVGSSNFKYGQQFRIYKIFLFAKFRGSKSGGFGFRAQTPTQKFSEKDGLIEKRFKDTAKIFYTVII